MKRLLRHKGFTLTETIIGLVVFMLLAGAASSIVLVGFRLFGRSALRNSAAAVGEEIYTLLENRLTYCTDLIISFRPEEAENEYSDKVFICIYVPADGSYVGMGTNTVYPGECITRNQMEGMSAEVKMTPDDYSESLVNITVSVYEKDGGSMLFTTSGTVERLNAANGNISDFCHVDSVDSGITGSYITFTEIG